MLRQLSGRAGSSPGRSTPPIEYFSSADITAGTMDLIQSPTVDGNPETKDEDQKGAYTSTVYAGGR